jgi:hypothetical protein
MHNRVLKYLSKLFFLVFVLSFVFIPSSASAATSTFGTTTVGANTDSGNSNNVTCNRYASSSSGKLSSLSVRVGNIDSAKAYSLAIYANSSSNTPTTLLGSATGTLTANTWNTLTISSAPSITAGTNYWLCYNSSSTKSAYNNMRYASGSTPAIYKAQKYGTWPSTFGTVGASWNSAYSIYATVTVTTVPTPTPTKAPTPTPTKVPTPTPTKAPTPTPTKVPTATPTKVPTATPTSATSCAKPAPTTAAGYQTLLRDTPMNGRWFHGDGGFSVALPNGKKLWIFGDSFTGTMSGQTQNWADQAVHNMALVQDKGCISPITGPVASNGKFTDWLKPTATQDRTDVEDYYWVNTPFMDGTKLRIFLLHMYNDADGFHIIGSDLATFNVSGATPVLEEIKGTPGANNGAYGLPFWGAAVIRDNSYTYIYGEPYVFGHYYYLARVPNDQLTNDFQWTYWTGTDWVGDQNQAQPVINGSEGLAAGVNIYQKPDGTNVFLNKKYDAFGTDIYAWTSPYLTGWTQQATPLVAPIPNVDEAAGENTYLAEAHNWATLASGKLLASWSLNSYAASFFGSPKYGIYFTEVTQP